MVGVNTRLWVFLREQALLEHCSLTFRNMNSFLLNRKDNVPGVELVVKRFEDKFSIS